MYDYGGGRRGEVIWWHKQIKNITKEKSHFVCSISLIVLYNSKVNHSLCNALGYKFFTFLCKYAYSQRTLRKNNESWVDISFQDLLGKGAGEGVGERLRANDDVI